MLPSELCLRCSLSPIGWSSSVAARVPNSRSHCTNVGYHGLQQDFEYPDETESAGEPDRLARTYGYDANSTRAHAGYEAPNHSIAKTHSHSLESGAG